MTQYLIAGFIVMQPRPGTKPANELIQCMYAKGRKYNKYINIVHSVNRKLQAFLKNEHYEHDTISTGKVFHRRVE